MKALSEAIEAAVNDGGDMDAAIALLADDVVFTSPAVLTPYPGKAITAAILRGVSRVFTDFHYTRVLEDGPHSALVFEARVGDFSVEGCDFVTVNDEGLISEFTVMVRPLKGLQALAEAMGAQFDQIKAEAVAAMENNA